MSINTFLNEYWKQFFAVVKKSCNEDKSLNVDEKAILKQIKLCKKNSTLVLIEQHMIDQNVIEQHGIDQYGTNL
jgi:hypothetical protein